MLIRGANGKCDLHIVCGSNISSFSYFVQNSGKKVPVWATVSDLKASHVGRKYLIYLVGGPNGWVRPQQLSPNRQRLLSNLLKAEIVPLLIAYAGTKERSYFPNADLPEAIDDLILVTQEIRSVDPQARICVLGESLGGYIAMQAIGKPEFRQAIAGYVLVNPLVLSPKRQYDIYVSGPDGMRLWYWTINRYIRDSRGDRYFGKVDELRFEIFKSFFGYLYFHEPVNEQGPDHLFKKVILSNDREPLFKENAQRMREIWDDNHIVNAWSRDHMLEDGIVRSWRDQQVLVSEAKACLAHAVRST